MNLVPHDLIFIVLAFFFLVRTYVYFKGRKVVTYLKNTYPKQWKEAGKPQPYYLIPHQTWSVFLKQKKYGAFEDPELNQMCQNQRKREKAYGFTAVTCLLIILATGAWHSYFKS